jgi:lysophospholipase L1-like esterase
MQTLFAMILSLIGPANKYVSPAPNSLQIKQGQQIVAIGDSITQAGGYLRMVDDFFEGKHPELKIPRIINAGISGQKAEDLVKRFEKDVVAKKPAFVTISIGINDVWHRLKEPHDLKVLKEYSRNVERMVKMAQDAKIKVILLAPTVIEENAESEGNKRLAMYVSAGKDIAKKHKCTYVDLHAMFLDAIKAAQKRPAFGDQNGVLKTDSKGGRFTTDGVHMKPAGDAIMAVGVLRGLGVSDNELGANRGSADE